MNNLIEKGNWGNDLPWEFYQSEKLPSLDLVTAVFCVAIYDDKIILMRAKRGWGILGGHIESGESILEALIRESQEEGGFTPHNPQLFGYRKITANKPITQQDGTYKYPYPDSYIVYYWAISEMKPITYTGTEVLESKSFTIDEVRELGLSDQSTIELGWKSYQDTIIEK